MQQQQQPPLRVIITVPHDKCDDGADDTINASVGVRICDTRAREAANALLAALHDAGVRDASIYHASSFRAPGADLNRPETRKTAWRIAIQTDVVDSLREGKRVVLFDMHSFPNEPSSFGTLPLAHNAVPQLVLLDDANLSHVDTALRRIARQTSVRLLAAHVGGDNDIVNTARATGADASLWEFNESSDALSHAQIVEIANALAAYARALG